MSFDILSSELSDTTTFQLRHPVNGPIFADDAETKPVMFEVYGKTSKVVRNYAATSARKAAMKEKSGKKDKTLTADELLVENAEFYATITKSITNLNMGGVEVDNDEAYRKMYANPKLNWVIEQLSEKFGEVDAFLAQ